MALAVADEVAHVLQQEVARPVEVRPAQVGHDHAVLDQAPCAPVEAVHACAHAPLRHVHTRQDPEGTGPALSECLTPDKRVARTACHSVQAFLPCKAAKVSVRWGTARGKTEQVCCGGRSKPGRARCPRQRQAVHGRGRGRAAARTGVALAGRPAAEEVHLPRRGQAAHRLCVQLRGGIPRLRQQRGASPPAPSSPGGGELQGCPVPCKQVGRSGPLPQYSAPALKAEVCAEGSPLGTRRTGRRGRPWSWRR